MNSQVRRIDKDTYLDLMAGSHQFNFFGLRPEWNPEDEDESGIMGFCHDEVVRQFHDTRVGWDGGVRVRWMLAAWDFARNQAQDGRLPDMDDILRLGDTIEPGVNSTVGFRVQNVWIGDSTGAPPRLLPVLMTLLVQKVADVRPEQGRIGPHPDTYRDLWGRDSKAREETVFAGFTDLLGYVETADDWYLAFEAIHPFGDGNGRTGKILHCWLLDTLEWPVLVHDYFGSGNP